jgi:hypothetical protein
MNIDKSKMKDPSNGNLRTQSLFLEAGYDRDAIFTLKDDDYVFEGKTYLSLKKIYLEMEDVGEYEFATTIFVNWGQWERICANRIFTKIIDGWRRELEIKMRGKGIAKMIKGADTSITAAKWVADRKWADRGAGRPTKEDVDYRAELEASVRDEFKSDVVRIHGDK